MESFQNRPEGTQSLSTVNCQLSIRRSRQIPISLKPGAKNFLLFVPETRKRATVRRSAAHCREIGFVPGGGPAGCLRGPGKSPVESVPGEMLSGSRGLGRRRSLPSQGRDGVPEGNRSPAGAVLYGAGRFPGRLPLRLPAKGIQIKQQCRPGKPERHCFFSFQGRSSELEFN